MKNIISFLLALTIAASAIAQKDSAAVKLVGKYKDQMVQLRWYPTSSSNWRMANKLGYKVSRMELGAENASMQEITTVKPYTESEWSRTNQEDDFMRATKEAVLSRPAMPSPDAEFEKMLEYQNEENGIFLTLVLSTNMNPAAAAAAGLTFTDKTAIAGKEYLYAVAINTKGSKEEEHGVLVVSTKKETATAIPLGFRLEEEEGAVKLYWNYSSNRRNFFGYAIERSSDGGRSFQPLNKLPLVFTVKDAEEVTYIDSVKNYIPYVYRVSGYTAFGDKSQPSATIAGMGRDKTAASPAANVRAMGDRNKILVSWEMPAMSKDLSGFYVGRGESLNGPFGNLNRQMITSEKRLFVDEKPLAKEPYYIVYTLDTANNISNTFSVMASVYDSAAPARPLSFAGRIDSSGISSLNWKFGTETDLQGYHVYVSTGKNNVYRQLTGFPLRDSVFTDTVNMRSLNREVYYKLTAVDYNNNPSPYSEILELKRPDIIAPAAPLINSYSVSGNKVQLGFVPSASQDVVKHELIRKDKNGRVVKLFSATAKPQTFTDSTAAEGADYVYELQAIDGSGLSKSSTPMVITVSETDKPSVSQFEASWDERNKQVSITWRYQLTGDYSFILFRSSSTGALKPIATVEKSSNSFQDNNVNAGKYAYAIKVITAGGAESELSRPVEVDVKL